MKYLLFYMKVINISEVSDEVVLVKKAPKKNNDVEAYKHKKETRKNVVPVGLASYDTSKPKPKKYEYDPYLDNIKQKLLTVLHEIFNISGCTDFCERFMRYSK